MLQTVGRFLMRDGPPRASGGDYEWGVVGALLDAGLPVRPVSPWKLRQFAKAARRRVRQTNIRRIEAGLVHLDQRIARAIAATAALARQRNEKDSRSPNPRCP